MRTKAKKVRTKSGRLVYESYMLNEKARKIMYRNPVSGFWADFKPRRDYGVYANIRSHSYTHNGEARFQ